MIDPGVWPSTVSAQILPLLFGYLLGSIPFGLILTRMAGLGDVRAIGSGNIGATNVLRTGRRDIAAATLVLDAGKGTAAVLIAAAIWSPVPAAIAGAGAFLGHIAPIWLGFRGGKGVATFLGVLIGLHWPTALVFAALWLGLALLLRYSSLAALVASAAAPVALLLFDRPLFAAIVGAMAVILWLRHHGNIRRLLAGRESRIGGRA
ncbi:MAG: glycerol-3-phosphate 1-O-acyltransferase PlsY [Bauldia sp.]|nr:glycerol-3-phosphate 1-O-acyltransferase PlsY [Bauldia sp.]